ncbi:hypothetical protein B0H16DRAFT_668075 [Mycena metata]|uniref:Transmembrane protein n=1 Tax=Mycena metata TaxID=1033252 RepID=A0AAD7J8Y7_9AGAR|nr:hypothetical protein B0H16DRAFT_668075 [Mycena metata]
MVSTSSQLAVSSSIPSVTTLSTPTPVAASTLSSAVDESATTPPIATTTATDFIVRIRISETVAVSTSTNVFTELSTVTVTSDPRIFTTVTPIVRTSTTLVPVSTGATVPDSISLSSHHKMVVVAGSVSAAVASVFVALIACIVCRRRRRRPASASSSFFSAPRATTNSVGAAPLSPSSTSRSRSPLFAPRSMDLEQGAEEMLDALDHAGPALQVPVRENQAIPFLRTHGGPQNVAVVPPMKGQAESTAWSITERTSAESSESSISEKSVNCRTGEHSDLQRSDTVHSNPPPDYATSCAS